MNLITNSDMATLLPHPQHLKCMTLICDKAGCVGKRTDENRSRGSSGCWPRRRSGARGRQAGGGDGDDLGEAASNPGRRGTQK
jgi:hypothetical protein